MNWASCASWGSPLLGRSVETMAGATAAAARLEHRVSGVVALCRAGLDANALRAGLLSRLWLSLHATRLQDPAGPRIGIVIQAVPPAELGSILLSAHGLTEAQVRVAALILKGRSTREIVAELHISGNTVQEHLTAVFDKFGVRSRRELVAATLAGSPHQS